MKGKMRSPNLIDDQWNSVGMTEVCKRRDVGCNAEVGRAYDEDRLRIGIRTELLL